MDLSPYFQIAHDYAPLAEEKQRALLIKAVKGDKESRNTLILHNFRLVVKFSQPFFKYSKQNPLVDIDDILSAGVEGLIRSITDFKPALGTKLSTYAWYWITQKIRELLQAELAEELAEDLPSSRNTEKDVYKDILVEKIQSKLKYLPFRERRVIREYYFEDRWMKEIGEEMYCSVERIRQIKEKGLKMLKTLI